MSFSDYTERCLLLSKGLAMKIDSTKLDDCVAKMDACVKGDGGPGSGPRKGGGGASRLTKSQQNTRSNSEANERSFVKSQRGAGLTKSQQQKRSNSEANERRFLDR